MRVLHVIPSLSPVHGGPSAALPLMERALTHTGIGVTSITTDDDGPGRRNGKPLGIPLKENGVERRYFAKRTEFYKGSPGLGSWVRRNVENYHLVHIHALFSHASLVAARAARATGVPYVIRPLGVLNEYGMTQRRALLKKWSFRWLEGPLVRDAAALHFTSKTEQEEAERLGAPMRSEVIPLGLELPEEAGDFARRKSYILYLSRLDPKKNLEGLLAAWAGLAGEFPTWKLVVAGDGVGDYVRSLHAMGNRLKIQERVEWLGRIEGEAKARWLREAGIYALPSFSENFGIAAVEAMGGGLPCLLSEGVAVGREAAKVGACLLTGTDANRIREGLRKLIEEDGWRKSLGLEAHAFAINEYGLETMGRRLADLYERVLKG